jgi:hypothetical protein
MINKLALSAGAIGGVVMLVGCGATASPARPAVAVAQLAADRGHIAGTWIVTVTPVGVPGGPFQSTIAFTGSGSVIEATSKPFAPPTADTSECHEEGPPWWRKWGVRSAQAPRRPPGDVVRRFGSQQEAPRCSPPR